MLLRIISHHQLMLTKGMHLKKLLWICLLLLWAFTAEAKAAFPNESTYSFIDFLMWQARESGADNWAQLISPAGEQRSAQLIDAPFNWHPGVRIGVGHEFTEHCYDIMVAYTHYQTQATNHITGIVYSSFVGNYFVNNTDGANFGPTYNSASIRWQLFYNSVDLNLGRNFNIDPVLQCHPYIGLKATAIYQNIYTHWLNPTTPTNFTAATENLKNDFWGIGPTIGVDSTWPIYSDACQSFSLIGNITAGLLWGHWHFNEVYANDTPITITTTVSSINGAAPVAAGLLGLLWRYQFAANTEISISLGYEAQVWFNQVQFYSLNLGRINRPLSLQGGNLDIRFNF